MAVLFFIYPPLPPGTVETVNDIIANITQLQVKAGGRTIRSIEK